jgi:hypothetical protein
LFWVLLQPSAIASKKEASQAKLGTGALTHQKKNYEKDLGLLGGFCAIKSNYESMLLMVSPTPKNEPAMSVETIEKFLHFK